MVMRFSRSVDSRFRPQATSWCRNVFGRAFNSDHSGDTITVNSIDTTSLHLIQICTVVCTLSLDSISMNLRIKSGFSSIIDLKFISLDLIVCNC